MSATEPPLVKETLPSCKNKKSRESTKYTKVYVAQVKNDTDVIYDFYLTCSPGTQFSFFTSVPGKPQFFPFHLSTPTRHPHPRQQETMAGPWLMATWYGRYGLP